MACLDAWDDPEAWQRVLVDGIRAMLDCPIVQVQVARPGGDIDVPEMLPLIWSGFDDASHERFYLDACDPENQPSWPHADRFIREAADDGSAAAFSRAMVVPDEDWYASALYREFVAPAGMDEWALACRTAPHLGGAAMIGGSRPKGAPAFEMKRLQSLGILAEEIVPLLGTRLSLAGQASKAGLTPRQRETLERLLDGMSEKQVASELGLSKATVHDYIVQLHKHFDVSSRGELLSYFVKRRPKPGSGG